MDWVIKGIIGLRKVIVTAIHKRRIYRWLLRTTMGKFDWRSTRAIASENNLTEDRVRDICTHHKKIVPSIGKQEDMWGIKDRVRPNSQS